MKQASKRQHGYSMVELLTVVSVFGVLTLTSTNLFFSSIVGSSKEAAVREVKQNGDFAVVQLESLIRNAKGIASECDGEPRQNIQLINSNDETVEISISDAGQTGAGLMLGGDELLSSKVSVVPDSMAILCRLDQNSGVVTVRVEFELSRGRPEIDKAEEIYSESFVATATLRNKY